VLTAAQERFEEPGWLVDPQLDVGHLTIADHDAQRTFAFDPGQRADLQFSAASVRHRPWLALADRPPASRAAANAVVL